MGEPQIGIGKIIQRLLRRWLFFYLGILQTSVHLKSAVLFTEIDKISQLRKDFGPTDGNNRQWETVSAVTLEGANG